MSQDNDANRAKELMMEHPWTGDPTSAGSSLARTLSSCAETAANSIC